MLLFGIKIEYRYLFLFEAGLRRGDVILTADDHQLTPWWKILDVISEHEPGEEVRLRVKRGLGDPREVTVTRLR